MLRLKVPMADKESSVKGFISWARLKALMENNSISTGVSSKEVITHFEVTDEGIAFGATTYKGSK